MLVMSSSCRLSSCRLYMKSLLRLRNVAVMKKCPSRPEEGGKGRQSKSDAIQQQQQQQQQVVRSHFPPTPLALKPAHLGLSQSL
jgi:hypothetical protein